VIPVTAGIAAAAAVGSLLAVSPWNHPSSPAVLRPTGLALVSASLNSISFHWSAPATGPAPDEYVILQGGTQVASLPGTSTSYTVTGLDPATPYQFQVIAVRGGKRSPVSATMTASTGTPPLSAALFNWDGVAKSTTTVIDPPDSVPPWGAIGKSSSDPWTVTSDCGSDQCGATVSGAIFENTFSMRLNRGTSGAQYTGTTTVNNFSTCDGKPVSGDTLSISITITHATLVANVWTADKWDGTATLYFPGSASCYADTFKFSEHSS
jgi:hypothetical protein